MPASDRPASRKGDHIKRVGIVFSGGPAPAANAVISSAAISFLEDDREVVGFFHGYSNLAGLPPGHPPAAARRALPDLRASKDLRGLRNTRGIVIGTARANPGKGIEKPADLDDPKKTAAPAQRLQRAGRSRDRRADLDRRRRHAQDRELPLRVPEAAAAGGARGSRSSTCPRRSTTTTAASTSRSASSPRST